MKTIIKRLRSETPKFWKKVRKYAVSIGTASIAVITINASMGLNLDPVLIKILGYVIAACAAIAGTASLTTTDK